MLNANASNTAPYKAPQVQLFQNDYFNKTVETYRIYRASLHVRFRDACNTYLSRQVPRYQVPELFLDTGPDSALLLLWMTYFSLAVSYNHSWTRRRSQISAIPLPSIPTPIPTYPCTRISHQAVQWHCSRFLMLFRALELRAMDMAHRFARFNPDIEKSLWFTQLISVGYGLNSQVLNASMETVN